MNWSSSAPMDAGGDVRKGFLIAVVIAFGMDRNNMVMCAKQLRRSLLNVTAHRDLRGRSNVLIKVPPKTRFLNQRLQIRRRHTTRNLLRELHHEAQGRR